MMTVATDYKEFYKMAGEFFRLAKDATYEQTENGHKCLTLAYLSLDQDKMTERESRQAPIIIDLASKTLSDKDPDAIKAKMAIANIRAFFDQPLSASSV